LGREEMHIECWWGNLREKDQLKDVGGYGTTITWILNKLVTGELDHAGSE
jgi:hypothetical protein